MEEISRLLREARERRGETIAEAEAETKIRAKYLEALEAGNPEVIPGEVFIKGFLRTYANHLGLDGPALVERYKALTARPAADRCPVPPPGAAADAGPAPGPPASPAPAAGPARPAPSRPLHEAAAARQAAVRRGTRPGSARYSAAVLWGAGLLVLAVALGISLARRGGGARPGPPAAVQPGPAGGQSTPAPAPAPAPAPPPTPQVRVEKGDLQVSGEMTLLPVTVSGADQISLQAKATQRCWLQVLADGKAAPIYEGTLQPGETKQWQASSTLRIHVGYPQGLQATINGQTYAPVHSYANPLWLEVRLQR